METNRTAIERFQPSQNTALANSLMGIETALSNAAQANVDQAIQGAEYTEMEIRSMKTIEELKLVNGMDLAAILLRGKLLKQIEDEALYSFHPNQYTTLQDMAREQGISLSELSNVRDLCFVVFPYMEEQLGMNVALTFENIGKSNMRELVPVIKAIISGEETRGTVQVAVERILNDTAATARAEAMANGDDEEIPDEEIRRQAISNILTAGEQMTNAELRRHVRRERTPGIDTTIIRNGGRRFVLAAMDEDQYTMFQRRMGTYMEPTEIALPDDPRQRRTEAARIPIVRDINRLME